jgi:hypothetical protein
MTESRLLHRTSVGEKLEGSTMFKCNVEAEVVQKLARDVGLNLAEMLWDVDGL